MRHDAIGFFWQDLPPEKKPKKEIAKRAPPEPIWERSDYLPGLNAALAFKPDPISNAILDSMLAEGEQFVFDIESYKNYFLAAFKGLKSNKIFCFEAFGNDPLSQANKMWLETILTKFCTIGFNSINYDVPLTTLAIGKEVNAAILKKATTDIIEFNVPHWQILRNHRVKKLQIDHIDLIEVAPLFANLKIYGGRMHIKRMQDLPFHPDTILSPEQIAITRHYCVNDLSATELLCNELKEQLELRDAMSIEYNMDLRSKSDAQIAEAVIVHEVERLTGNRPTAPIIVVGTTYKYVLPPFIKFKTPCLQQLAAWVQTLEYIVAEHGSIIMPKALSEAEIKIGEQTYTMKIGGLHSTEKSCYHISDDKTLLTDFDVTSYYPFLILNQNLYPEHIGQIFTHIFSDIVSRRLHAKATGNKTVANSLKITINGTYGKLGSKYSAVYSPQHLVQVTLSGQLALLSLIESVELIGVKVVSANTDGIMCKYDASKKEALSNVVKEWEQTTGFELESNDYCGLFSRDVNNYIAIKKPTSKEPKLVCKGKGVFARPSLSKNPDGEIEVIAIEEFLMHHTPIEKTIRECADITKFLKVRTVKGGAVKIWDNERNEYLGKSIRWYYCNDSDTEIVYALSGNKVPLSEGAQPAMQLPDTFPSNVDYEKYIANAYDLLTQLGFTNAA